MIERIVGKLFGKIIDKAYEEGYHTGMSAGSIHAMSTVAQRLNNHDISGFAVPEMVLGYEQARKAVEGVL